MYVKYKNRQNQCVRSGNKEKTEIKKNKYVEWKKSTENNVEGLAKQG